VGYHLPCSVEEALGLIASGRARIVAGGTDVYPALGDRPLAGDIVDVTRIAALRGIVRHGDGFAIGALTTWSDIAGADLPAQFDGLKAAAREVGSIQIQNAATVAGNLCNASPAADGVPPLLALDAAVEIAGPTGLRRLGLADFITGVRQTAVQPDELVTAIHVPALAPGTRSAFLKLGARRYLVISIAMAAAVLVPNGKGRIAAARVAVGSCSPVAVRLKALEAALVGCSWSQAAATVGADHVAPLCAIDDIRATAAYRREAALELVRRTLADCLVGERP
jgi:CO/xanthine dehydrogenase FAD-binding subunit